MTDSTIAKITAPATTITGTGTAAGGYWFFDFLTVYGVAIGLFFTLFFGFVNWYYRHKEDKRREIESDHWKKSITPNTDSS